ncbi:MAG TPA: ABC transporter permease [Vicinamibacteria bacterium]|nr:ABC transporter permease [Vicinamibacteria bacterium]
MANLPLANIFNRKTRTTVGILAVALGVATVLVLVGLAHGSLDETAERITNVGADIIFQAPDSSPFLVLNSGVLPDRLAPMLDEIPGVATAAPVLTGRVTRLKGQNKLVMIFGVDLESYDRVGSGIEIVEGRALRDVSDLVVDTVLSEVDGIPIGNRLEIMGREFEVVGIAKAGAGVRMYMTLEAMQTATAQPGKASFYFIKVDDGADVGQVAAALEKRFEGYVITALEFFSEAMTENALGLKEFIRALSFFAACISYLVILLAMYTTIIERTREIGILKALGASKGYIMKIVMVESFLICAMGVGAGFALSVFGRSLLLSFFPTLSVDLIPRWFLFSAILGITGGLLGALYPAYRAAKLDPVEALNFE